MFKTVRPYVSEHNIFQSLDNLSIKNMVFILSSFFLFYFLSPPLFEPSVLYKGTKAGVSKSVYNTAACVYSVGTHNGAAFSGTCHVQHKQAGEFIVS